MSSFAGEIYDPGLPHRIDLRPSVTAMFCDREWSMVLQAAKTSVFCVLRFEVAVGEDLRQEGRSPGWRKREGDLPSGVM